VEIRVALDNQGLGWFGLAARTAAGGQTDLKRTDHDDADGDASFLVTPSADLTFRLQVLGGYVAAAGSTAWIKVLQGGRVLECRDSAGKTLNKSGSTYVPVQLGAVAQAKTSRFNFEVWS